MDLVIKRCCGQLPICQTEGDGVLSVKCPTCGRELRFSAYLDRGEYLPVNLEELKKQVQEWNEGVITIGR